MGPSARLIDAKDIRRIIIEESHRAHVGHIGSSLSIADILAALYGGILNVQSPTDPDRDRFVLSKGHAALALYAALALRGIIDPQQLQTYCGDSSLLGVHPEHELPGVDFSTGSLGQGLSFAAGAALGARLGGSRRRAFALLSDAECNEGSVWEAAMFASHQRLSNLIALVDVNGQQALGYTKDVIEIRSLGACWASFGWDVHDVDGHDPDAITASVAALNVVDGPPHILICRTIFGKGVSFMQSLIKWHYWPMSPDEFAQAMSEIDAR